MGSAILIQYQGFKAKTRLREYNFVVKGSAEEVFEFRLTIPNDAFLTNRVRYQDGPDICSHRIQRELDATGNHPLKMYHVISDAELEEYRMAHSPKGKRGMMYKPSREAF